MKKITANFLIFMLVFSLHMPAFAKKNIKTESTLDKRSVQTKIYDTKSKTELMKIALNILQDENYKIINLDNDLGIITAVKQSNRPRPLRVKVGYYAGFLAMAGISFGIYATWAWIYIKDAHTPYNVENVVTLNVFDLNNKQRKIRISANEKVFAPHTLDKTTLKSIQDPDNQFYKDFFINLDKEVFITKQDL